MERAQNIIRSATHMAHLVDKTLKTTRLETGQLALRFRVTDVSAPVREAVSRFPRDAQRPVRVDLPDHPLPAWADGDRLAEVVENLLSNAFKYSPDGGEIRILAPAGAGDGGVGGRGPGHRLLPEDRDRLFRPFSRVRSAGRRESRARASASTSPTASCGPTAAASRWRASPTADRPSPSAFPSSASTEKARSPLVLVAARDGGTRRDVRRVAEALGYVTHEVADGVEAFEAALRLKPSVVIMDRVLPRLAADELAVRLKAHATTSGVPLLALASRADLGDRAQLFEAFVPQPLDGEHLAGARALLHPLIGGDLVRRLLLLVSAVAQLRGRAVGAIQYRDAALQVGDRHVGRRGCSRPPAAAGGRSIHAVERSCMCLPSRVNHCRRWFAAVRHEHRRLPCPRVSIDDLVGVLNFPASRASVLFPPQEATYSPLEL